MLFLALAAPQVSAQMDGHPRRPDQDILSYGVSVDLSDPEDGPGITTVVEVRAAAPITELVLDYLGPPIQAVTDARRRGLKHRRENGLLVIALPEPLAVDATTSVVVTAKGWPGRGLIRQDNRHGEPVVFTDAWPSDTRWWMPCEDHPSDKALFVCGLILPKGWRGIANGARDAAQDLTDGRRIVRWKTRGEIYTAVMVFAAGPFTVVKDDWDDVPLEWWLYGADAEAGARDFAVHGDVLDWIQETIGPYPWAKYAVVQIPTKYGGMENASNTFLAEGAVDGKGGALGTLVHEAAHQWWGDAVTVSDWTELWLSEGFATYFTALWFEVSADDPMSGAAELRRRMKASRAAVLASEAVESRSVVATTPAAEPLDMAALLDANAYQKGSWVLHMLRRRLGDEAFFAGLRVYYAAHAGGNATTGDLRAALEEASGERLAPFFRQWLERPGWVKWHGRVRVDGDDLVIDWTQPRSARGQEEPWTFDLVVEGLPGPGNGLIDGPLRRTTLPCEDARGSVRLVGWGDVTALRLDPDVDLLGAFTLEGLELASF